ncbi:DUF4238 domain-containing protein [Pseudomonas nicosulfuronedens]|uniref:DUF4238 domain-containing protein n=1 Tax=Pseudomonas nicosulfuronedens TaxID=2571105 RepID=UPI00244D412A|nr:DUF4238 domain-containing protein [Pseudomonas nicosulfuronedens]MDH1012235.1 DUF4238 domain-containing protein [Pseudomonas nicosulfuronedens]MDH1982742.1 DUF4238 domain-containing protein [Pseudomonas nicosulfuronedens]MDH2030023.1 DUF4238 domain-containing protein [Pseudomonas nicosulfuronedens]
MSEPKKHHYVPRSYQELFRNLETNEIYRLDMSTGKSTRSNPENTLYKKHLYTLENPPKGIERTHIENPLLSELDDRFVKAIRELDNDIKSVDKETLSICVSFLRNRTPSRIEEFGQHAAENQLNDIYNHILLDPQKTEQAKQIGFELTSFENFKSSLQGITVSAGNDYNLQGFLVSSSFLSSSFFEKKWTLLVSNSKSFITSDKPVTATEIIDDDSGQISQFYLIPLSSRFCIKSHFFDGDIDIIEIGDEEIDEVNMAIAYCAQQLIVGPSEPQLQKLFENIGQLKV